MKKDAYLNDISLAVPEHDIHRKFVALAPFLLKDRRHRVLFRRMAERCQLDHRYSCVNPHTEAGKLDRDGFYGTNGFPDTKKRMALYQQHAFTLARKALDGLRLEEMKDQITHLIVTTCTGF